ncbi:hypothetical protein [Leclercia adecarboxylata]|uniref:hypothetical protein n=1 Tax=Leclercia adecarboxylata TaxID=83655 RepID=UPI00159BB6B0|nr:hypothetical protein [Leclercia adecarboxylata]
MIKDWIKNHLIPEKRDSGLWPGFADALQQAYEDQVEPLLERLSARKSFFTMHADDLDKRIKEYGQFFVIGENGTASRPILLTQRLDEVHFKGTDQPIISTFWREFGNLPVTWEPLYAPVDQDLCPYGMFFTTAAGMEIAQASFGEFFLTSRGTISVDLNRLYEIYGFDEQDKLVKRLISDFDRIVAPLLPLETVFDGISLRLDFWLEEARDEIEIVSITTGSKEPNFVFRPARELMQLTRATVKNPTVAIAPDRRSLDTFMLTLDGMPSDAWRLDMPMIIPSLLPGGPENDPRLRIDDTRLLLDTLGQWGCVMELTTGEVSRLAFPGWALSVVLPVAASDRALIRKITWCSEAESRHILMSAQDTSQIVKLSTFDISSMATLYSNAGVIDLEGIATRAETTVSGQIPDTETQHISLGDMPSDGWRLDAQDIPAPVVPGSRPDTRLISDGEKVTLETLGQWGCVIELTTGDVFRFAFPGWADCAILPFEIALIRKITYSTEQDIHAVNATVHEQSDKLDSTATRATSNQVLGETQTDISNDKTTEQWNATAEVNKPNVQPDAATIDNMPLDAWPLDQEIPQE